LSEPLDVEIAGVAVGLVVGFGVALNAAEEGVGVSEVGVEGVIDVAVEIEGAVEGGATGGIAGGFFNVDAELEVVLVPDLGQVVGPVPDVVGAEEGEALFDVENASIGDAAEIGLGDEVARVGLREELREIGGDIRAVVAVEASLGERVDGL